MMKKNLPIIIYICGLISTTSIVAKSTVSNDLEAKIDAMIPSEINASTPGLVIGVVQKGKIIFSKGYGMANLAYGIPNDPKLVYNTGSVSKQFLGYAFAMLHFDGQLNIDDPVGKYLDDWPEFKHQVTLRHLLSHTSGYREAYTMSNLAGRIVGVDHLSRQECLDVVRKQPELEFVPGSRYTYNSTAWVILSEVLKKVTGQESDQWVETNILKPLKMNDTKIESFVGEIIENSAESYSIDEEKGFINEDSNRAIFGAAEIYSNITDMAKWMNNFKTAEIGGENVIELFLKPFILNDGSNSEYALGIKNGFYRGLKRFRHTGGHEAFLTQLSYFPDHELGIFTVTNFGGKGWIDTSKIADILLGKHMNQSAKKPHKKVNVGQPELEKFTGLYVSNNFNRTMELKIVDGFLSDGKTKFIPTSKNTFAIDDWDGEITIENKNNTVQLIQVSSTKQVFVKTKKWTPKEGEFIEFIGDYWSEELETVYHLTVNNNNLTLNHRWLGQIPLTPVAQDLFTTDWGYFVKFNRNQTSKISNLSIYSGRTLNVVFKLKNHKA